MGKAEEALTELLQELGRDDAADLAKFLYRNRICACVCEACGRLRQAHVLVKEVRPLVRPWKGYVLSIGNAWLWVVKVEAKGEKLRGSAQVAIHYDRSVNSIGQLYAHPFDDESPSILTLDYDGAWSSNQYPHTVESEPPRVVEPDTTRNVPEQYYVHCPGCGHQEFETWLGDPPRPGHTSIIEGVKGEFCDDCGEHFAFEAFKLRPAPRVITADDSPWDDPFQLVA